MDNYEDENKALLERFATALKEGDVTADFDVEVCLLAYAQYNLVVLSYSVLCTVKVNHMYPGCALLLKSKCCFKRTLGNLMDCCIIALEQSDTISVF